ncbi:coenzyme F420 hydrogenase subunit alpha [Methanoplanus sp. FWC-SCC4]|uniref:Coenzyme F420 hydrogenase subunit alpha n=1 Tax=Methanochimaera problematica TaxID=2609417 RepID=A0AA97FEA4_9EURY|nr:coenzyme F420 hydrogenase subunit alpha [Methanoplanus sp. FWC-SCC4]WOF16683.1 coenzyme F420 hydrogenase subunit alpha [Methanoplanus sp. FWC-SCC4]
MSKVVEVSPTTRHEGHTKLVLKVNDDGIIERGDWLSITPVRGIEKLAIGKTMHQAPKISSRVCGICPIAHTLAGIEAMEGSIGCEIPDDAYLLRIILQCANRLHSHALHNILTLPDMYLPGTDTHINPFSKEEPVRSVALRIQRLREIGQTVGEIAGGEPIHPSNPRIGGMYKNISPRGKAKIYDLAKEAVGLAHDQMEFMITVLKDWENRGTASVAGSYEVEKDDKFGFHDQGYMAVDPLYASTNLDADPKWFPERWTEVRPWDWYMGEQEITLDDPNYPNHATTPAGGKAWPQVEACTAVPMYDGAPIEVGPRARLAMFRNYDKKGAMGLQIARQMEYPDCLYSMIEAVDALDTSGAVVADEIPQGDGSLGWAANEAPRGTDVHLAKVKDGRVQWYSLLVPTTWNFPVCSRALEGAPWQLAEVIVRAYDPCVSCATHMMVVDEKKKVVAQKLVQ